MKNGSLFAHLHAVDTEVTVKDNVAHAPKDQRALLFSPSLCLLQRKAQLRRRFIAQASALNFLKAAKTKCLKGRKALEKTRPRRDRPQLQLSDPHFVLLSLLKEASFWGVDASPSAAT